MEVRVLDSNRSSVDARLEVLRWPRRTPSDKEVVAVRHCLGISARESLRASDENWKWTSTPTEAPVDEILEAADVGKTQIAGAGGIARLQGINDLILKAEREGEKWLLRANTF